jgi:hypothetical protein
MTPFTRSLVARWRLAVPFASTLVSCGAPSSAQPDRMSAADHRRSADAERARARERIARHDANRDEQERARIPDGASPPGRGSQPGDPPDDGTSRQLWSADAHTRHAAEHDRAAAELERFEERECARIARELRASARCSAR